MAKRSTIRGNWPKYLLQWGSLAALIFFFSGLYTLLFPKAEPADPERYCPLGGLEALGTYLASDTLPCSMTSVQIVMGIALAAAVVLFGKLFCAYLCPIGTVEDLLKKLRGAMGFKGVVVRDGSVADKLLRLVKYVLLFVTFRITMETSELFCKNFDPYYAAATGFKGEITLWASLATLAVVLLAGLVIDRFWCKYVCPLGAVSNTLKFWEWVLLTVAVYWVLSLLGLGIPWIWLLGALCLVGYLLEILSGKPKLQLLGVIVNETKCTRSCRSCVKNCPYNIDVPSFRGKVNAVDCMLCGECLASCPTRALSIGVKSGPSPKASRFTRFLPAIIAVVLVAAAYIVGGRFELPTIDEKWGITEDMQIETVTLEGLKSVKCFSSSKAFKAKMENVPGVHGVKTYVGSHRVVVSFDPSRTSAEKIQQEAFVPSTFRVSSPDPALYPRVKRLTLRTEGMYDRMDLNYLGMQMRLTGKKIFGLESVYDCPLIIYVYMDPAEQLDEDWFRQTVEKKTLDMPASGGSVREIPLDFEFVRLEKEEGTMPIAEYLDMMFDHFKAEYNGRYEEDGQTVVRKRSEVYAGQPQWIYRISDQNYEKPIVMRGLPYLSNHLSKEEGVIGTYLTLDDSLVPCLEIRFAAPMTEDRLWELMNMDTWTITYSEDDVREESAKMSFKEKGVCLPYTAEDAE